MSKSWDSLLTATPSGNISPSQHNSLNKSVGSKHRVNSNLKEKIGNYNSSTVINIYNKSKNEIDEINSAKNNDESDNDNIRTRYDARGNKILYVNNDSEIFGNFSKSIFNLSRWSLKEPKTATAPALFRYRQTRFSSRRVRRRVVFKHGDCNVVQGNVAKRRRRYLQDIFTTLVDAQWRWTLLVFALNFILSWLAFAVLWWLILVSHGDFESHTNDTTWVPCVEGVTSFTSCFLFSVETQHTIGYGAKHTTEECPEAIFIMCLQSITGVMIQAFMVGIVFAKLSRPKKRTQTLLFSRNAVICQRNRQLCLMFRVGDMRKSHIIEAHVRAQLIRKRITKEGEVLPFFQQEMKVGADGAEDRIFFIWPTTIVHNITPESPLYKLSANDMLHEKFEIVVILEGVIESTGMTTQARSSYLPNEILWGHRFANLVSFKKETGEHEVDYSQFNQTYQVDTPLCSAYSLDRLLSAQQSFDGNNLEDAPSTTSGCSNTECPNLLTPTISAEQINDTNDTIVVTLLPTSSALMQNTEVIPGPESDV